MIQKQMRTGSETVSVTFTVEATGHERPILLAGDFTGWEADPVELLEAGDERVAVTVVLPAGRSHEFRYLDARGRWFNDDQADGYQPNAWGGANGIVRT